MTVYDDVDTGVIVFNAYGDITYSNSTAADYVDSDNICRLKNDKLRVMAHSLLTGLTVSPLIFHADVGGQERLLCHIHGLYSSYTVLLQKACRHRAASAKPDITRFRLD